LPTADIGAVKAKLAAKDVVFVAERVIPGSDHTAVYLTAKTVTNQQYLVELKFKAGSNICKVTVKSPSRAFSELIKVGVSKAVMAI